MRSLKLALTGLILLILLISINLSAGEARILRFPDIYKNKIAFCNGGDIWVSDLNGGYARKVTSGEGEEFFPKFSPDGKWIAFTGQYTGTFEVYVIPAEGGDPRQLTFYPGATGDDRHGIDNQVMSWTPDGKFIVFRSLRSQWDPPAGRYYKVSPQGGWPQTLPFGEGATMSYSPDGKKIVMNRQYRDFRTWKRYKGGRAQDLWIYDFDSDKFEQISDWPGTENNPMWHGDKIYFASDQTGVFNIYSYDIKTKQFKQLTNYTDWDVRWPGFDDESVIFELGGKLYRMTFEDEKVSPITVNIAYDNAAIMPKYIDVGEDITDGDLSPAGKRVAIIARGELFTVPAEKGNIRNLSNTSGARESSTAWSPDGKWIAFISDETGNEELYITCPLGKKKIQLTQDSKVIIRRPVWSPDSKKIAFYSLDQKLFYIDISTKQATTVDTATIGLLNSYDWSPDSEWIVYDKNDEVNRVPLIFLYNLSAKKVYQITDNMIPNYSPVFDPAGKYIYFISQRDFSPTFSNVENSFSYNELARVYVMTLKKNTPNPFAPESDEVEIAKEEKKADKKDKKDDKEKKEKVKTVIDIENLGDRVVALPVSPSNVFGAFVGDGAVYYIKRETGSRESVLFGYDFKEKKEVEMLRGVDGASISPDRKKILWGTRRSLGIVDAKPAKIDPSKGKLNTKGMITLKDPKAEWRQMLKEAYRLNRDLFYVKNMHGVDWEGMLKKYLPLVDYMTHRRDLSYIMGEMVSELCIGHTYVGSGSALPKVEDVEIGLLGAALEPDKDGYFMIKKIYRGENWHDNSRSPLTEPGVKVKEGDYILEINGKPLRLPGNPYKLLEKTIGTIVTLRLGEKLDDKNAWSVEIKPIANESSLRYLDWVETNRQKVDKVTAGKVGYVHIPDMSVQGLNQFVKTWFAQLRKDGVIIDDRYNGGGFVSQMILERLRRTVVGMRNSRLGGIFTYPGQGYPGYLVALINHYAASDGDIFPYYFRKYGLGEIIGTRTWGGVVGISGFTPLMDGGYVTIPTSGSYGMDSEWIMENIGTEPDIEVDLLPNDLVKGIDPQLDKAIEIIMKKIKEKPVKLPPQPADPVKLK